MISRSCYVHAKSIGEVLLIQLSIYFISEKRLYLQLYLSSTAVVQQLYLSSISTVHDKVIIQKKMQQKIVQEFYYLIATHFKHFIAHLLFSCSCCTAISIISCCSKLSTKIELDLLTVSNIRTKI